MMPPKYLSRQKPQNIELNLTEIAPTSTKEGRSGKEANIQQENKSTTLRPDVLSYLSNLENKLHSQEVETKNNEDKYPKKELKPKETISKNVHEEHILHWSDLSMSSESPLSNDSEKVVPIRKVQSEDKLKPPVRDEASISSSIVNVKTLSDISTIVELDNKLRENKFTLQRSTDSPIKQIRSLSSINTDLESSLPPKSPFHPFTFKLTMSTSSSSIRTEKPVSDIEAESIESATPSPSMSEEETENEKPQHISSVVEENETDYGSDFESEESGFEESQATTSQTHTHADEVAKRMVHKVSVAVKNTQTDDMVSPTDAIPFAIRRADTVSLIHPAVPWQYYYSVEPANMTFHPTGMNEILHSALSAHLDCIKSFVEFQSTVFDKWNDILQMQRRNFTVIPKSDNKKANRKQHDNNTTNHGLPASRKEK